MTYSLLLTLNIVCAVLLVAVVLLQKSESGLGSAFGGVNSMAAAATKRNPLVKATIILAFGFMGSCAALAYVSTMDTGNESLVVETAS